MLSKEKQIMQWTDWNFGLKGNKYETLALWNLGNKTYEKAV